MISRVAVCLMLSALPAACADWNPKLAAQYLDARQKDWFAWPAANGGAKPCISCHTGLTYLLEQGQLSVGDRVMLVGIGYGWFWASALVECVEIPDWPPAA